MAGSPPLERGISPGAEIKPFSEVSPEEIARRSGGRLGYFQGEPLWIDYPKIGAQIVWRSDHPDDLMPGEGSASFLRISGKHQRDEDHELVFAAVILEEGSVTFVGPISRYNPDYRVYSWVTISEEGITSHVRAVREREPWRLHEEWSLIDPKIAEAAGLATRRLQES